MDVLFAILPFADVRYPALGASLLKAHAERRGVRAAVRYFNFDLAERMDLDLYAWFAQLGGDAGGLVGPAVLESLVGEWFFSDVAFPGRGSAPEADYVATFLDRPGIRELLPAILEARRHRRDLVEGWTREIRRLAPKAVGFATTFQQTCACLAVARRLKREPHPPLVLFGGANCEGEMGLQLLRSFPWIDYVCTGEGDVAVPLFLDRLREGGPQDIPGMLGRRELRLTMPARVQDMDALPLPDYSDYFERLGGSTIAGRVEPRLPLETARGCWWGEKQHCVFCGLNGETMAFRSKSPGRVLREIEHLTRTYGVSRIDAVDNILDLTYVKTVFETLIRRGPKVDLFYETKANLRYEQLRTMRDAGVRRIQPGIESFSDRTLRLMRKGCTGLQNVQLLRWCEELGVTVGWNLLFGFPDESPGEYERMARLLPLLAHLQPPWYCGPIRLDRFSPLFADPARFGLGAVHPIPAYSHVFPLGAEDLGHLAYFFGFEYDDARDPTAYTADLVREAALWAARDGRQAAQLDLIRSGPAALVTDTRPCAVKPVHVMGGLVADAYLACDTVQTAASLARLLGGAMGEPEARALLQPLVEAKLMVESEGHYLSLAVFRNRPVQRLRRAARRASPRGAPHPVQASQPTPAR